MAILSAVAVGKRTVGGRRVDVDFALQGRRPLAAAALLCATVVLFATPPVVAMLVIAGLVR